MGSEHNSFPSYPTTQVPLKTDRHVGLIGNAHADAWLAAQSPKQLGRNGCRCIFRRGSAGK